MNYQKMHDFIINRARNRTISGYSEKHHILPKCLGGKNNVENLVKLTAKEHYFIHRLLTFIYPDNDKIIFSFWAMCRYSKKSSGKRYIVPSRIYARIKDQMSLINSKRMKENNPFKDKKHSSISLMKMSDFGKSKPINLKAVEAMKIANTGKKKPTRIIENLSKIASIPVIQLDLQGNFLREWSSMTEANIELGIEKYDSNISLCTKTGRSARGFLWIKKSEYDTNIQYKYTGRQGKANHKKVYQYDLKWNLMKEWDCIQYAAKALNIHDMSIHQCLRDENKRTCKGFKWSRNLK